MKMSLQFLRACLVAAVVRTSLELPAPSIVRPCDRQDGCRKTRPDAVSTETDPTGSTADWFQDDYPAEDDNMLAELSEISYEPAQDKLVLTELLKSLQQIQRKANSTKQLRLGKLLSGIVTKQNRRRKAKANKPNTVVSQEAVTPPSKQTRDQTTSSDFVMTKTAVPSTTSHQPTPSTPTHKPENDITFDVALPEWFWDPQRTLSPFQFFDDTPAAPAELRDDENVQTDGTLSVDTNFGGEILPLPDRLGPDHTSLITSSEQDLLDQLAVWSKMSLEADKSTYPLDTELEGEEAPKQDEKFSSLRKEKPDTTTETLRCYRDLETRTTYYRGRPCPRQTRPQLTDPLCHTRRFLAPNGCCKEWWVVCN